MSITNGINEHEYRLRTYSSATSGNGVFLLTRGLCTWEDYLCHLCNTVRSDALSSVFLVVETLNVEVIKFLRVLSSVLPDQKIILVHDVALPLLTTRQLHSLGILTIDVSALGANNVDVSALANSSCHMLLDQLVVEFSYELRVLSSEDELSDRDWLVVSVKDDAYLEDSAIELATTYWDANLYIIPSIILSEGASQKLLLKAL